MSENANAPVDRADVERASDAIIGIVTEVMHDLHPGRGQHAPVTLDSTLDGDLALDSLARVELGARLERGFDVTLDERLAVEAATPRDLLRAVMKAHAGRPLTVRAVSAAATASADIALPADAQTLGEMLAWHVARHPERPHIQFFDDYSDGAVLSYGDLWHGARRVAGALLAHGLEPGERVALMLPTGRAYFMTFYGALLAGGVPVPIYPPVRRQQLEDHLRRQSRILANCRAALLVTTADAIRVAHLLTAAVDSLRHVLDADKLDAATALEELVARRADDVAFLQYTSGSTGDLKGVMLSHANLLANVRADGAGMGATPADVFVSWLPLYHDMGLIGAWLGSLYHGVRLVVMPPLSFLARPERWLWAIHRYGGTLSAAPNFAYELCLKRIRDSDIDGLDLSHWRIAANGAEAISARTLEAFCTRFAAYGFAREAMFPVYGLAECAVGLAFPPLGRGPLIDDIERETLARQGRAVPAAPGSPARLRIVACGQPLPGHELRVVDSAGRELPERHEGRLQFRGPSATSGYFGRPEATRALFSDGWLETGDRAYIAGGELYVTGRIKDVIIRAGRNIYPAELEDAVGELDGVRKGHVAVFGSPDADSGTERVIVMAETRRQGEAARAALTTAINELATDLIAAPPDRVVLVKPNTVLRTSSGKIRRAATRTLFEQDRLGTHEHAVWLQVAHLALAGVVPQLRRLRRALIEKLYAVWAWGVFASHALAVFVVASLPLPARPVWRATRFIARSALLLCGLRVDLHGRDALPAEGSPCIIVANHQSYLDGMVLTAVLPRPVRFLVKADLAGSALLRRPLERLGALFVDRFDRSAGVATTRNAAAAFAAGAALGVFPEGTFKRMPGVLPFHLGAFVSAVEGGVPVVPLAVHGTRSLLRAGSWWPRRGRVTLTLGRPIAPSATPGVEAGNEAGNEAARWRAVLALRDAARAHILAHCAEPDLAHESNVVEDEA